MGLPRSLGVIVPTSAQMKRMKLPVNLNHHHLLCSRDQFSPFFSQQQYGCDFSQTVFCLDRVNNIQSKHKCCSGSTLYLVGRESSLLPDLLPLIPLGIAPIADTASQRYGILIQGRHVCIFVNYTQPYECVTDLSPGSISISLLFFSMHY